MAAICMVDTFRSIMEKSSLNEVSRLQMSTWIFDYWCYEMWDEFQREYTVDSATDRHILQGLLMMNIDCTEERLKLSSFMRLIVCLADGEGIEYVYSDDDADKDTTPLENALMYYDNLMASFTDSENEVETVRDMLRVQAVMVCCRAGQFDLAENVFQNIWGDSTRGMTQQEETMYQILQSSIEKKKLKPSLNVHTYEKFLHKATTLLQKLYESFPVPFLRLVQAKFAKKCESDRANIEEDTASESILDETTSLEDNHNTSEISPIKGFRHLKRTIDEVTSQHHPDGDGDNGMPSISNETNQPPTKRGRCNQNNNNIDRCNEAMILLALPHLGLTEADLELTQNSPIHDKRYNLRSQKNLEPSFKYPTPDKTSNVADPSTSQSLGDDVQVVSTHRQRSQASPRQQIPDVRYRRSPKILELSFKSPTPKKLVPSAKFSTPDKTANVADPPTSQSLDNDDIEVLSFPRKRKSKTCSSTPKASPAKTQTSQLAKMFTPEKRRLRNQTSSPQPPVTSPKPQTQPSPSTTKSPVAGTSSTVTNGNMSPPVASSNGVTSSEKNDIYSFDESDSESSEDSPTRKKVPEGSGVQFLNQTPKRGKSIRHKKYQPNRVTVNRADVPSTSHDAPSFDDSSEDDRPVLHSPKVRQSLDPSNWISCPHALKKPTSKKPWTEREVSELKKALNHFGPGKWSLMLLHYNFNGRTNVNLKDKWRNMVKNGEI